MDQLIDCVDWGSRVGEHGGVQSDRVRSRRLGIPDKTWSVVRGRSRGRGGAFIFFGGY